jgi:hypothetical protein
VEVLDVKGMKRLVLGFEKSIARNLEARMKHVADPEKFVESELDLDDEIRKLHTLATAPSLYPELVRAEPASECPPHPTLNLAFRRGVSARNDDSTMCK